MATILNLTTRNMKLFLRDKMNLILSFTSVGVLVMLYLFFLGKSFEDAITNIFVDLGYTVDANQVKVLVNATMIAGLLFINSINLPITILGRMAMDKSTKALRDFYVTPVGKGQILAGYILSSIIITFCFNVLILTLGQIYILSLGGSMWSISIISMTLLLSTLSIIVFSSLIMFLITFVKNEMHLNAVATVLGILSGFLAGLYVPFTALSQSISNFLSVLPFAGITSLLKTQLLDNTIANVLKDIPKGEAYDSIHEALVNSTGATLYINDDPVSTGLIYGIIFGFTAIMLGLTIFRLVKTKER